jgi:hypothetical protein
MEFSGGQGLRKRFVNDPTNCMDELGGPSWVRSHFTSFKGQGVKDRKEMLSMDLAYIPLHMSPCFPALEEEIFMLIVPKDMRYLNGF